MRLVLWSSLMPFSFIFLRFILLRLLLIILLFFSRTFEPKFLNQNSFMINASPADLSYLFYGIVIVFASWP